MIKSWDDFAWKDTLFWQAQDKKILKRINLLLQDIDRNGYTGIGKPEALKNDLQGYYSRRIDHTHRLVYRIHHDRIEIIHAGHTIKISNRIIPSINTTRS